MEQAEKWRTLYVVYFQVVLGVIALLGHKMSGLFTRLVVGAPEYTTDCWYLIDGRITMRLFANRKFVLLTSLMIKLLTICLPVLMAAIAGEAFIEGQPSFVGLHANHVKARSGGIVKYDRDVVASINYICHREKACGTKRPNMYEVEITQSPLFWNVVNSVRLDEIQQLYFGAAYGARAVEELDNADELIHDSLVLLEDVRSLIFTGRNSTVMPAISSGNNLILFKNFEECVSMVTVEKTNRTVAGYDTENEIPYYKKSWLEGVNTMFRYFEVLNTTKDMRVDERELNSVWQETILITGGLDEGDYLHIRYTADYGGVNHTLVVKLKEKFYCLEEGEEYPFRFFGPTFLSAEFGWESDMVGVFGRILEVFPGSTNYIFKAAQIGFATSGLPEVTICGNASKVNLSGKHCLRTSEVFGIANYPYPVVDLKIYLVLILLAVVCVSIRIAKMAGWVRLASTVLDSIEWTTDGENCLKVVCKDRADGTTEMGSRKPAKIIAAIIAGVYEFWQAVGLRKVNWRHLVRNTFLVADADMLRVWVTKATNTNIGHIYVAVKALNLDDEELKPDTELDGRYKGNECFSGSDKGDSDEKYSSETIYSGKVETEREETNSLDVEGEGEEVQLYDVTPIEAMVLYHASESNSENRSYRTLRSSPVSGAEVEALLEAISNVHVLGENMDVRQVIDAPDFKRTVEEALRTLNTESVVRIVNRKVYSTGVCNAELDICGLLESPKVVGLISNIIKLTNKYLSERADVFFFLAYLMMTREHAYKVLTHLEGDMTKDLLSEVATLGGLSDEESGCNLVEVVLEVASSSLRPYLHEVMVRALTGCFSREDVTYMQLVARRSLARALATVIKRLAHRQQSENTVTECSGTSSSNPESVTYANVLASGAGGVGDGKSEKEPGGPDFEVGRDVGDQAVVTMSLARRSQQCREIPTDGNESKSEERRTGRCLGYSVNMVVEIGMFINTCHEDDMNGLELYENLERVSNGTISCLGTLHTVPATVHTPRTLNGKIKLGEDSFTRLKNENRKRDRKRKAAFCEGKRQSESKRRVREEILSIETQCGGASRTGSQPDKLWRLLRTRAIMRVTRKVPYIKATRYYTLSLLTLNIIVD